MSTFKELTSQAQGRNLRFMVIGGLAVNLYGVSRETADLDLLVCREDEQVWGTMLSASGYSASRTTPTFAQFAPPSDVAWPVDLMLVNRATFDPMWLQSREADMYGVYVRIPSLQHLIALKLHALKHAHVGRFMKDYLDVENLVRANRVDLHSDEIRVLFLKYGTGDIYEKIKHSCAHDEASE